MARTGVSTQVFFSIIADQSLNHQHQWLLPSKQDVYGCECIFCAGWNTNTIIILKYSDTA